MNRSNVLVGSWELKSRIDRAANGEERQEPTLGSDPLAFLVFDSTGHFAAQFMKRDRTTALDGQAGGASANNSVARGGYDAYFGTYTLDEARGVLSTLLRGALSQENVGQTFVRYVAVDDDILTLKLDTTAANGEAITRTLRWQRVA
jgi:Lipocalin-like domain